MRSKTGILLVNLGTPDAPTPKALRKYLGEFLSDPRVVEAPRLLWWPVLHGIILNTRPARSAKKYAGIWTPGGSPLLMYTRSLAEKLEARLGLPVAAAMRYGNPGIAPGLQALRQRGCDDFLILPLYPQYAASTTGSVYDGVFAALKAWRDQPGLALVRHYYRHPAYVEALRAHVSAYWMAHGQPDILLISFHGLPRKATALGDPYELECKDTARRLIAALGLSPDRVRVCFQSRFGPSEWLQPYTDKTLEALGRAKTPRVDVLCPGFATDCLETLEEIADEGKETFLSAGGGEYHYIPALNDSEAAVAVLGAVVNAHRPEAITNPSTDSNPV